MNVPTGQSKRPPRGGGAKSCLWGVRAVHRFRSERHPRTYTRPFVLNPAFNCQFLKAALQHLPLVTNTSASLGGWI